VFVCEFGRIESSKEQTVVEIFDILHFFLNQISTLSLTLSNVVKNGAFLRHVGDLSVSYIQRESFERDFKKNRSRVSQKLSRKPRDVPNLTHMLKSTYRYIYQSIYQNGDC